MLNIHLLHLIQQEKELFHFVHFIFLLWLVFIIESLYSEGALSDTLNLSVMILKHVILIDTFFIIKTHFCLFMFIIPC